MDNSIFVGATYVETLAEGDSDAQRRFCLQVWRGTDLISLQQDRFVSTTSPLELPFVPYHLVHFGHGKLWLAGSDCKVHQFTVGTNTDLTVTENTDHHPLASATFSSPVIKMGLKEFQGAMWVAVAAEDGRLAVYKVANNEAKLTMSHSFEGLSDVNFTVVDKQMDLVAVVSMD